MKRFRCRLGDVQPGIEHIERVDIGVIDVTMRLHTRFFEIFNIVQGLRIKRFSVADKV